MGGYDGGAQRRLQGAVSRTSRLAPVCRVRSSRNGVRGATTLVTTEVLSSLQLIFCHYSTDMVPAAARPQDIAIAYLPARACTKGKFQVKVGSTWRINHNCKAHDGLRTQRPSPQVKHLQ